jgi:hypothetical protein
MAEIDNNMNHFFLGNWFDQGKESFSYFHIHPISSLDGTIDSPFGTNLIADSNQLDAFDGQGVPGEEGFYTYPALTSNDCCDHTSSPPTVLEQLIGNRVYHSLTMNHGFDAAVKQSGNFHKLPVVITPTLTHLSPIITGCMEASGKRDQPVNPPNLIYLGAKPQLGNTIEPDGILEPIGKILKTFNTPLVQLGIRSLSTFDLLAQSLFTIGSVGARDLMMVRDYSGLNQLVTQTLSKHRSKEDTKRQTILILDGDVLDPSIWALDRQILGITIPGGLSYYCLTSILEILTYHQKINSVVITHSSPNPNTFVLADLTQKLLGFLSRSPINNPELVIPNKQNRSASSSPSLPRGGE